MPVYLNTLGNQSLAIAICARCSCKFPIGELMPDPNSPGLRVCKDDRDVLDPYRLPPLVPDKIVVENARPDTPLGTNPQGLITQGNPSFTAFLMTQDGEQYLVP